MLTFRSKLCATWFVALVDALVRVFHPRASRRARLRFVVPVARNCRPLVVTEAVTGVVVLPRRREILPAARCRLRRARGLVVHFFAREWQGRVAAHAAFCIVLAFLEFCAHILFPRQISAHWVTAGFRAALATAPFGIAVAVFAVVQVAPWLGAIVDGVVLVRVADGAAVAAAAVPVACIVVVAAVAGGGSRFARSRPFRSRTRRRCLRSRRNRLGTTCTFQPRSRSCPSPRSTEVVCLLPSRERRSPSNGTCRYDESHRNVQAYVSIHRQR